MSMHKCFLKSVESSHDPIELKHKEEKIFGRGPESGIHETRCSRKQIKIVADCEKREATVTQLGRNACGINGMSLSKDQSVTIKEGDRIELLIGQFVYVVEFEPQRGQKRPASSPESKKDDLRESDVEDGSGEPESVRQRKSSDSGESSGIASNKWESVDDGKLLVYTPPGVAPSTLIAAYDLDGTLIGTNSGNVFPKHKDDWKVLYFEILTKLKEMHDNKYKIVIFTNQRGLTTGRTNDTNFKSKIEKIVMKIGLPIQVFVATGYSQYRKPAIGMWEAMVQRNGGVEIDMTKSFYCGDAAGREASGPKKTKDFSQSDYLFAKNLNLHFEVPEHHFLKKEMPPLKVKVFDPNSIPCNIPLCSPSWGQIISNKLEVIVLVGCPGSGKSHFVKTHLIPAGYVHVNRDTLGSWNRCVSVMEAALRSKQKVVVDNTNPDVESRKRYITIAKNYTPFVRCFIINTSLAHCKHNNKFRQMTDSNHALVTDVVMNLYNSKYREPTTDEGFTEILRINFWPTFKDPRQEKLYKMFLMDK